MLIINFEDKFKTNFESRTLNPSFCFMFYYKTRIIKLTFFLTSEVLQMTSVLINSPNSWLFIFSIETQKLCEIIQGNFRKLFQFTNEFVPKWIHYLCACVSPYLHLFFTNAYNKVTFYFIFVCFIFQQK